MTENIKQTYPSQDIIGFVVGGGLKENLHVRLTVATQQVQEGSFLVAEYGGWQFYGIVTDMQLGASDMRFADAPINQRLPQGLANLLQAQTLYTNIIMLPALMLEIGPDPASQDYQRWLIEKNGNPQLNPQPIKTIPSHHAIVRLASGGDVATIFGKPEEPSNFILGYTREQNHAVCVNLEKMVQRSAGVFGATGTGKSFLVRLLLAGLIKHDKASTLVFDMHNEYGFDDISSDTGLSVPGMRTKFGSKVRVVGLGAATQIRDHNPDFHVEIAAADIQPEDIELLTQELNLRETTPATLEALVSSFGRDKWFASFKAMKHDAMKEENGKKVPASDSVAFWAASNGVNEIAAKALHSKLQRVFNKPYIQDAPASSGLQDIIDTLKSGRHVILSFGNFESDLDYLLISNLITRKLREEWVSATNNFRSGKQTEPRQLVVVVEEAHKILNREMASQTSFSTIAREMRKYYLTLLIVDQRPSQIFDEVMSQLGTRISGWLGDEDDIHAVLSGLAGRDALRGMLARLQPKEEVLMLGWGVPMPILLRSRRYDEQFWHDILKKKGAQSPEEIAKELGY